MMKSELKLTFILTSIVSLRMLGIFLILPIFSVFALQYPDGNRMKAGLALGIYALFQALLQIPTGWLSDRIGRKPVILGGLFIFSLGSILCAFAPTLSLLILARAFQGCGSISSVAMALLGDRTSKQTRAQAYTILGIGIGSTFIIGLILGPILVHVIGFSGLFFILGVLAFLALLVAAIFLPSDKDAKIEHEKKTSPLVLLKDPPFFLLGISTALLSFLLNLFFFLYPLIWKELHVDESRLGRIYFIIVVPAALMTFPFIRIMEKRNKLRTPVLVGWITLFLGQGLLLFFPHHELTLYLSGAFFFIGYSLFQPILPTLLTRRYGMEVRGTATGGYNLMGYLGSGLGGMITGYLSHFQTSTPLILGVFFILIWGLLALPIPARILGPETEVSPS